MNSATFESNLHLFHNVTAPGTFLVARNLSQMLAFSAILMMCLFLVIVFKALRRADNQKSAVKRNTLKLLLANIICTSATNLWGISILMGLDTKVCINSGRLGSSFYGMSNFFAYCLLLKRAKAVESSSIGYSQKTIFTTVLGLVKIGTALVPFVIAASFFGSEGKTYFYEEFCVVHIDGTLIWLFLCLDTSLSFGYLLLFLLPVLEHMRMMSNGSVEPASETDSHIGRSQLRSTKSFSEASARRNVKIKATAKRNLLISSVAIGSSLIFLAADSLISQFKGDEMELVPYLHWLNWTHYGGSIDLCTNSICVMLMFKGLWTTEGKGVIINDRRKTIKAKELRGDGAANQPTDLNGRILQPREPLFSDSSEV